MAVPVITMQFALSCSQRIKQKTWGFLVPVFDYYHQTLLVVKTTKQYEPQIRHNFSGSGRYEITCVVEMRDIT